MIDDANKKVIIEQNKRFSQSALWPMQREYFDKKGIHAWVNQVPFYITSNPFIADCYAELVFAFIRDWTEQNPEAKNHPFYIMELGTGSGRFSYYVVKALAEMVQRFKTKNIKICYVMSDFTQNNMQYWETHPALKPYIDEGLIDFALYDMEADTPITLIKKNICLNQETLVNPLIVFANYIFDTISHDSFTVRDGKLYELLLNLSTDEKNMQDGQPISMERISVDYSLNEVKEAYYNDPHLDSILDEYKSALNSTSFLFPIGSMRAIQFLSKLSNNKLLIVSTDKGYNTLDSLDHLNHPVISFHGSFSMMVNFHALAAYLKKSGGDAMLQKPRKGIKTSVFSSGFKLGDLPTMSLAIEKQVDGFSPGDYFILHTRMSESFQACSLATLAAHMQLALWDPHMYLKLTNHILSKIKEGKEDAETVYFMAHNMAKMASHYYYMPNTQCALFEIGLFFHAIKQYEEAVRYYQQAENYIERQFSLYYNLALCQHHLGDNGPALENFKKAYEIDNRSKETEQWISFLENTQ